MGAVVRHRHRLGEALGLVVDPTRADRIDIAPIALSLGVHLRVPVDFRSRRKQVRRTLGLCETQRVVGAERADLEGLNRHLEVVARRRRACEVEHGIDVARDPDIVRDVMFHEREAGQSKQVLDVGVVPGREVVDGDNLVATTEQLVGEVRSQEASSTGDHHAGHQEKPTPW